MGGRWELPEAEPRFSELITAAQGGAPQFVTRNGADVAVVMDADEYRRLRVAGSQFADGR